VGIAFTPPTTGRYRACFEFGHFGAADAVGRIFTTFQLVETGLTTVAVVSEGNSRVPSAPDGTTAVAQALTMSMNVCGEFTFTSATKKLIRLMFEQDTDATVTTNLLRLGREATAGQRDLHITIEKMNQQFPTPVFTDLTNSLARKVEIGGTIDEAIKMCSAHITCSGSSSIVSQSGDCLSSIGNISAGACVLTFTDDVQFFEACHSNENATNPGANLGFHTQAPGSDQITVDCDVSSSGADCTPTFTSFITCIYR